MKATVLFGLLSLLLNLSLSAQEIPQTVQQAFRAKYPQAKKVNWEKESKHWEAEFKTAGRKHESLFSARGEWLETETELKIQQLPEAVKASARQKYPAYALKEAGEVQRPGGTFYEIELKNAAKQLEVLLNFEGRVVETEEEMEEEDN